MAGIFDQHFVRADRRHAVVEAVAAARRVAFNVVERSRDGPPRAPTMAAPGAPEWWRSIAAGAVKSGQKRQTEFGTRSGFGDVVSGDDPGAGDRIFAKFHGIRKTPA